MLVKREITVMLDSSYKKQAEEAGNFYLEGKF